MDVNISPINITYGIVIIVTSGILYCINKLIAKDNANVFKGAWMLELALGLIIYAAIRYNNDTSDNKSDSINQLKTFSLILVFLLFSAALHLFNTTVANGSPIIYSILAMIEIVLGVVVYSFTIYKSTT
jgi:ABC-type uncharacterized transport system permease subunit